MMAARLGDRRKQRVGVEWGHGFRAARERGVWGGMVWAAAQHVDVLRATY